MIISQIISLSDRVIVFFSLCCPIWPECRRLCAQTLQTHLRDLSSRSDASCRNGKWPELLCGFLQRLEEAGLAEQVGTSGAGLLTLLS